MKRLGNIWNDVCDLDNGFVAIWEGTQKKRGKRACQKFLFSPEQIAEDPTLYRVIDPVKAKSYVEKEIIPLLKNQTWEPDKPRYIRRYCVNKTASKGKWRDLYVPSLRDHIIHHMIMQSTMSAFMRGMHPHCCGSVPGRGIKHIIKTVRRWFIRDKKCKYFVKLDIKHFFDSIDADILMDKLRRKIKDKYVLWAFEKIIHSAPVACPVGFYPSPWLSNLYLEDFDHFVEQDLYKERRGKRIKFVRHYLRYADDMLLMGTSHGDLKKAIKAIIDYLLSNQHLEIKNSWEIKRIGQHEVVDGRRRLKRGTYWCDIGGYKFCKDSVIGRDRIYLSTKRLAKKMNKGEYYSPHQCQSFNARIAWMNHADSYGFLQELRNYVNIKRTREVIGYVDKIRKRREYQAVSS